MTIAAGQIVRASQLADLLRVEFAASNLNNSFVAGTSNVRQDLNGVTFNVTTTNPNAQVIVTFVMDASVTTIAAGQIIEARLEVDGVAQPGTAKADTADVSRETVSQTITVVHPAPGTFTYKITAVCSNSTPSVTVAATSTTMTALVIDLA